MSIQIEEFGQLPSYVDEMCEICEQVSASFYVTTVKGLELVVCTNCFDKMLNIEYLLQKEKR